VPHLCLKAVNIGRERTSDNIDKSRLNLLKEAAFLSEFSCSAFPRLVEVDRNGACLLMEKKLGHLLSTCQQQLARHHRLTVLRDLLVFAQEFAARGVIHRDIKPRNIIISSANASIRTCLIDFGSMEWVSQARVDHGPRKSKLGNGKYLYQPPEQLLSLYENLGTAADMFAIGATYFALEFGQPPFRNNEANPMRALRSYARQENQIWRTIAARESLGWLGEYLFALLRVDSRFRLIDLAELVAKLNAQLARSRFRKEK
jgi:serine/threonine protein kinase